VPGESDGECNGGPAAGNVWDKGALELVSNSKWGAAAMGK
jgi:endoglucanase